MQTCNVSIAIAELEKSKETVRRCDLTRKRRIAQIMSAANK